MVLDPSHENDCSKTGEPVGAEQAIRAPSLLISAPSAYAAQPSDLSSAGAVALGNPLQIGRLGTPLQIGRLGTPLKIGRLGVGVPLRPLVCL